MKQTAVEWFAEKIGHNSLMALTEYNEILEQAKAMEKEQIIRAHLMARCYDTPNSYNEAEQYYNETFKSE